MYASFSNASKALEKESGLRAEPDDCTARMLSCVSTGRWKEALDLLSSVQVTCLPLSCDLQQYVDVEVVLCWYSSESNV